MSYKTITVEGTTIDLSEQIVLASLGRTYNPMAQGQADIIRQCWMFYNLPENKLRREKFKRLRLMYGDRQEMQFVDDVLKPLMGKEANGQWTYDTMPVKPIVSVSNFVKKVVDKQATLYDDQPERDIDDEASEETYKEIAKEIGLDYIMQAFERAQVLYKTAFLRPVVRNGRLDADILTPEIFYPITDPEDATIIKACFWVVQSCIKPDDIHFATWYYLDNERFFWFQMTNGQVVKVSGTDDMPGSVVIGENTGEDGEVYGNSLGELGILKACTNKTEEVIEYPGDSMISLQNNLNILETLKTNSLIYQGFPILHIHGMDNTDPQTGEKRKIRTSPWTAIVTEGRPGEEKPSVAFIAPATKVAEFNDAITQKIDMFLLSNGISKNLIMDSTTSGAALKERNRDIVELRKSKIPQYTRIEQELYKLFALICETSEVDGDYKLKKDAEFTINYSEPDIDGLTPIEQADLDQKKIDQGLLSQAMILKRDNPEMDDEAVADLLVTIKKDTGVNANIFSNAKTTANNIIASAVNERTDKGTIQE